MAVKKKYKLKTKALVTLLIVLGSFLILLAGIYMFMGSPIDANNSNDIEITIPSGTSVRGIGNILEKNDLIRNSSFFAIVVKLGKNNLKASTYTLNKTMSMQEIIKIMHEGNNYNPDSVRITFKEGKRLTDYAKLIANNTNSTYDDVIKVMNDKTYINELITKYWFLTTDILNTDIYYPLEGYLFPDTYEFKNKDVDIKEIITAMLDETNKKLEPYKSKISNSPHKYITMASIVELEGTNTENRKMIVGVFNNRIKLGMNLGSDVTTYYALQEPMTRDLTSDEFKTNNSYNTRSTTMMGKLPVGPICSPGISAIEASANPTNNDYLYFVADKNGKIYYTKTVAEHDKKVKEIKDAGDWIW
ncbi:MAG: endolytic transglycosylase MltG [Firmicutes bacterium]|nr:endolytic transglycosylase MltG [Bacillota bacterium]